MSLLGAGIALINKNSPRSSLFQTSYLKEADNLLAATKISSVVTAPRTKLPFVQQENDHYVPATSVVASVEAAGNQELQVSLGAEEAARRELAKKRSLNFDSKPPLGSSDSFGDSHLVRGNLQSFDFSDMAHFVLDGQGQFTGQF